MQAVELLPDIGDDLFAIRIGNAVRNGHGYDILAGGAGMVRDVVEYGLVRNRHETIRRFCETIISIKYKDFGELSTYRCTIFETIRAVAVACNENRTKTTDDSIPLTTIKDDDLGLNRTNGDDPPSPERYTI